MHSERRSRSRPHFYRSCAPACVVAKTAARLASEVAGFLTLAEAVVPVLGEGERCTDAARRRRIVTALEEQAEVRRGVA
jgi:hypothetical protein